MACEQFYLLLVFFFKGLNVIPYFIVLKGKSEQVSLSKHYRHQYSFPFPLLLLLAKLYRLSGSLTATT